ncbi:CRISPR-associated protein, Csd1 family [Clostridium collagenovorans DSM 3089]|uniref:CRISPR-associated protein, Csd1 family n=1 Tax=Clostridium collagenovorans DSM 3089 TaxID=1121306 RepID=A0A1M5UTM9_9CLOT|nr:type I-C CRISPR-associated protein Cas8c/Csd1 [Clostridium collagenovorans]SHH66260.1 CRISPR-associated protein, Csd1 family [Clostridium collagenovorans DSM 3089]
MILQDLCNYYDILAKEESVEDLPRENTSMQKVLFALVISEEGKLKAIMDLSTLEGKKKFPRQLLVPEQPGRSGKNAPSYFLCDNSKYVLGLGDKEEYPSFNSFKSVHNEYLQEDSPVLKFINSWEPEKCRDNTILVPHIKELEKNSNIVFRIEGKSGYYHEQEGILDRWKNSLLSEDEEKMQCLITGEVASIARIHTPIKGVRNAQAAGASIVSFNDESFNSYGKTASYNAPVSKKAMFKYTTVLNYMLRSSKNKMTIGDNTVVFWAEKYGIYEDLLAELLSPTMADEDKENLQKSGINNEAMQLAKDILTKYSMGLKLTSEDYQIETDTKIHILGISPNNARLAIAFYEVNSFDYFAKRISQHYKDLSIIGNEKSMPIWMVLSETVPKTSKDKKISPVLSKSLMASIFEGRKYPVSLYNAMITRIRADKTINYKRAAIIKAYLNRKSRLNNQQEVISVSLNEESKSIPYHLGRLFAVLEKAQKDAIPNLNTTIKDSYFTSACATPASVFPRLINLSFHHVKKAEYGFKMEKRKGDILESISKFPQRLSLDEQGEFILGYYHENQDLYKAKGVK